MDAKMDQIYKTREEYVEKFKCQYDLTKDFKGNEIVTTINDFEPLITLFNAYTKEETFDKKWRIMTRKHRD